MDEPAAPSPSPREPAPYGRCWHCGKPLPSKEMQLQLYKMLCDRMSAVCEETARLTPLTNENRARWFELQDEFTGLMRRIEIVIPRSQPVDGRPSITCIACGLTSYHPNDIRERFCGRCHKWHADASEYTLGGADLSLPGPKP